MKENQEEQIKTKESLSYCLKQYLGDTGCHGCNKVQRGHFFRRWIWALCILISLGILVHTVVKELRSYYSYPVLTQFQYESLDETYFPAITICNSCPYSKKRIQPDKRSENYYFSLSPLRGLAQPINWTDPFYNESGYFEERTEEHIWSTAVNMKEFLTLITFDGQYMEHKRVLNQTITNYGPCFTFNADGAITTKLSGAIYNLMIYANINQTDYTWSSYFDAGIKILIHDPATIPDMISYGLYIPPGSNTDIKISETRTSFLPYPYHYTKGKYCRERGRNNYDQKRCHIKCVALEIFRMCKCRNPADPIDAPICSKYQYKTCVLSYLERILVNQTFIESCECPKACESSTYESSISMSRFPSTFFGEALNKILNISDYEEIASKNYIMMKVYFKDLERTVIKQVPKYTSIEQVFANLGGQMGLFLGASIITIIEFSEMLCAVIYISAKKLYKRTVVMPNNTNSFKSKSKLNEDNKEKMRDSIDANNISSIFHYNGLNGNNE